MGLKATLKDLGAKSKLIIFCIALLFGVHVINTILGGQLNQFGIIPRSETHWFHVFTSPFLHASWAHLFNNLVGLGVFGLFCILRSKAAFIVGSIFIISLTGLLVWFFGRSAIHIGASGWIFGLWSFSISIAIFDRRLINILTSIVIVFLYGGMAYGVLPSDPRISFEAHLFGAVAGFVFAFIYAKYSRQLKKSIR